MRDKGMVIVGAGEAGARAAVELRAARASAILYSIVETAKANGLKPEAYLQCHVGHSRSAALRSAVCRCRHPAAPVQIVAAVPHLVLMDIRTLVCRSVLSTMPSCLSICQRPSFHPRQHKQE
jgi:hypothetical protein